MSKENILDKINAALKTIGGVAQVKRHKTHDTLIITFPDYREKLVLRAHLEDIPPNAIKTILALHGVDDKVLEKVFA